MPIDHIKAAKSLLTRNKIKENLFFLNKRAAEYNQSLNGSNQKGALSSHREKKKQSNAFNHIDDKLT